MERRRLIKIAEVADILGLRPQTVRNKLGNGTFPIPPKRIGRLLRWDKKDIDLYLDNLKNINC